ncbi:MAG: hypothetical protein GY943_17135 [Chloroflexi bacterium]|nr:hypothetical protein [Chloroflexota bacterium]
MKNVNAQKIHIIGGAGTGKTTLASKLSAKLGYPCYYLDHIGWNETGKVPLDKRMSDVNQIIAKPQWITEGVFLWWTDPLLENADVIIWLDLPFSITVWRILKRHVLASLRGNNPHSGIKLLIKFVYGTAKQHYRKEPLVPASPDDDFAITRAATKQIIGKYEEKLIHYRRSKEVAQILNLKALNECHD